MKQRSKPRITDPETRRIWRAFWPHTLTDAERAEFERDRQKAQAREAELPLERTR